MLKYLLLCRQYSWYGLCSFLHTLSVSFLQFLRRLRLTSWRRLVSVVCLGGVLLFIGQYAFHLTGAVTRDAEPFLEPCTIVDDIYEDLPFASLEFDQWDDAYHAIVAAIFDEYLQAGEVDNAQCTVASFEDFIPAGPLLQNLASALPPWKEPEKLALLRRSDIGAVLLEFLRIYECVMVEREYLLPVEIIDEFAERDSTGFQRINIVTHANESADRKQKIRDELGLSRATLERMFNLIAMSESLDNIEAELICLQRASLDIRNATALAAEAASCLPRVFNAKDSLRSSFIQQ